ncbi:MAG: mechanosensitive ion channel family protein [Christensenella sp.]
MMAADIAKTAADTFAEWEKGIFSLGFVNTIIYAAIAAVVAFVLIKLIQHFFAKKFSGNARIFYRLIYVAIILIAICCVLATIKPLNNIGTAILASSGIAAVVIGLAAQQTLGNVFSGISISAAKPFEVGEYIEILNVTPPIMGIVKDIGLRHTTILDASNKSIVIPNSVIDKEMIRAFHNSEQVNVCSFLDVGISFASDLDFAMKLMAEVIAAHKDCIDVRTAKEKESGVAAQTVRIQDLGESAVKLRGFVWTRDTATSFQVLSDLRYAVKKAFDENNIEIPYPYRNVVVKNSTNNVK